MEYKVYPFIFIPMKDLRKNIKIPPLVHKELKVYAAHSGENMDDVAGVAIMEKLKQLGHKFVHPIKSSKK